MPLSPSHLLQPFLFNNGFAVAVFLTGEAQSPIHTIGQANPRFETSTQLLYIMDVMTASKLVRTSQHTNTRSRRSRILCLYAVSRRWQVLLSAVLHVSPVVLVAGLVVIHV